MAPKLYRDESTPDRKEIWEFVERAAARSNEARIEVAEPREQGATPPPTPTNDHS